MAGPWRVRFIHHDDGAWQRLIAAGLVPPDGGAYELFQAAKADPARVMEVAGGFMPWPFFSAHGDPEDRSLGCFAICPQCGEPGSIHIRHDDRFPGAVWSWNGSADAPTTTPSIWSDPAKGGCGGHYFLTNGILTDCGGHRPLSPAPPNPSLGGDHMADETQAPTTPAETEAPAPKGPETEAEHFEALIRRLMTDTGRTWDEVARHLRAWRDAHLREHHAPKAEAAPVAPAVEAPVASEPPAPEVPAPAEAPATPAEAAPTATA